MNEQKRSRDQWFVEPIGADPAHSNKVAAREIVYDGASIAKIMGDDGESHDVWQCRDYAQAKRLMDSRQTTQAVFELWTRNRTYGPIRKASNFMGSQKRRRAIKKQVTAAIAAQRAVRT